MAGRRNLWRTVRLVWVITGLAVTAVFVVWSLLAYRASEEGRKAAVPDQNVMVSHVGGVWRYDPPGEARNSTLIFFPGALVDSRAYAPLARALAQAGHPVIIVDLPRRGTFGGAESAELASRIESALSAVSDSGAVVFGGHSKGGVVASAATAQHVSRVDGLLLLGTTHPRDVDLSALTIPVTKIAGTRDGLAKPEAVKRNAALLPPHTRWIWVEGGNHSQFGWYGFQPMDRTARIDAKEQRAIMIDGVIALLRDVSDKQSAMTGELQ